jgi:hypothetical protein
MGSNLVERYQNEGALGEARVRHFKAGLAEHEIAIEDEIEIECTRTVGDGVEPVAAEFLF